MDIQSLVGDLNTNVATLTTEVKAWRSSNDEAHTRFVETLKDHGEQLKMLDKSIRGNSKAGLNERTNVLETDMRDRKRWRRVAISAAAVALFGAVASITVAVLTFVLTNMQTVQGATP